MPVLKEADIKANEIGGIRDLVMDYIQNVCGGTITARVNQNWKITGNDWDPDLHQKAVDEVNTGTLTVSDDSIQTGTNCIKITVESLAE